MHYFHNKAEIHNWLLNFPQSKSKLGRPIFSFWKVLVSNSLRIAFDLEKILRPCQN